ncbi:MAG: transposase [Cenarchaeum sp. SB0665_bin_23]|nr:transposase [Cenarchaeum sp. SB0665_bin_23]MXZ93055.1 transposase [Cenarchaeum sp. SB0666_bin_15]MYD58513.1 transposase [Cenarchaeum sp. SB0678_bin_8]MYG32509.1 transposase [Cenarchaeum sp. SB0677_bin_16]MYJ27266.1 transposase [Cenarchaeum sp. SB0672_bin_9]
MSCPVEIDEVYLGGCEKNKHADRKDKNKKTTAVGIGDRKTGVIRVIPVPETIAARLLAFIEANVDPNSKKFPKNRVYRELKNHDAVNHGGGEYVRGEVHINGMWFWALVWREYNCTPHSIKPKYLHRYIDEFGGRLSMKALGTVYEMCTIVQNLECKSLSYAHLVAQYVMWPANPSQI